MRSPHFLLLAPLLVLACGSSDDSSMSEVSAGGMAGSSAGASDGGKSGLSGASGAGSPGGAGGAGGAGQGGAAAGQPSGSGGDGPAGSSGAGQAGHLQGGNEHGGSAAGEASGGASGQAGAGFGGGGQGGTTGLGGQGGSLNPNDHPVAMCTFDTAQQIPNELAPYVHIVFDGIRFVPSCIKSQGLATTVTFHGLSPTNRLRGMTNSGNPPNPISVGEPHEAEFTIENLAGGPYGFYIEGQGSDGPPGETGLASGAIYLTGTP